MSQQPGCPSTEVLRAVALGKGTLKDPGKFQTHLEKCESCRTQFESLSALTLTTPLNKPRQEVGGRAEPPGGKPSQEFLSFLAPPVEPGEIGRLGNYRVLGILGQGGMGVVFRGEDLTLHRPVALKVMRPEMKGDADGWGRFLREARTMAKIKHDNLVTIFTADQVGDVFFFAMELLEGETLDQWMKRVSRPAVKDIVRLGREIAAGLAFIHQKDLIHRDIKPANIWLEAPAGRVKILDLGLARPIEDDTNITHAGMILGTPGFMSPEQARGETVDTRTDLFSLGCVLYYLCTGRKPFQGKSSTAVLMALASEQPLPVKEINPEIPSALADLVMQLLARRPQKRPASAEVVLKQLEAIEAELQTDLPAASPAPQENRKTKSLSKKKRPREDDTEAVPPRSRRTRASRNWMLPIVAGAVLGSILLGVVVALILMAQRRPTPASPTQPAVVDNSGGKDKLKEKIQPFLPPDDKTPNIIPVEPKLGKKEPEDKPFMDDKPPKPAPPPPPSPPVYLTELKETAREHWPFKYEDKKDSKKKKDDLKKEFDLSVRFQGKPIHHGIFMHPPLPPLEGKPASLTYHLNNEYRDFQVDVSLNDGPEMSEAPITFYVYGNDRLLWKSNPVLTQKDTQTCKVSLVGVDQLRIAVTAQGEPRGAHGVWIDPKLSK